MLTNDELHTLTPKDCQPLNPNVEMLTKNDALHTLYNSYKGQRLNSQRLNKVIHGKIE